MIWSRYFALFAAVLGVAVAFGDAAYGLRVVELKMYSDRFDDVALGVVFLDGADINLEMVATGNAWHYSHFDKTAEYAEAEKVAREKRRGLWSAPSPESPFEFRKRTRSGR